MSTQAASNEPQALRERLAAEQAEAASRVAPWFFANMPAYYFATHDENEQALHLHAVVAQQVLGGRQTLRVHNTEADRETYLLPGRWVKELLGVVDTGEAELEGARIYSSRDGTMRLCDFLYAPQERAAEAPELISRAVRMMREAGELGRADEKAFRDFLAAGTRDYASRFETGRGARHFRVWRQAADSDAALVELHPDVDECIHRVVLALRAPRGTALLGGAIRAFARWAVDIERAYLDVFTRKGERFVLASFYVTCATDLPREEAVWGELAAELAALKWRPRHDLDRLVDEGALHLDGSALLQAACGFAQQMLLKVDRYAYSLENIVRQVQAHRDQALALVAYFRARFDPAMPDRESAMAEALAAAEKSIACVDEHIWRRLFETMLDFMRKTLRTSLFVPQRWGLAFRLDPAVLGEGYVGPGQERPFGLYYVDGPHSQGFHVRFRDSSRGGVRIVPARTQVRYETESNRLLDEALALARAQQFKNKDIPEGGSKAVILLGPEGDADLALKAFVDGILDLIACGCDEPAPPGVVDYVGRQEVLYLGPDENVTTAHIEWMVARARERGYPYPAAFMSSKPRTGINHKAFGVTSLGVVEFMEEALAFLEIDPAGEPFRVKLTGGPRGDVASNCMRILAERYPDTALIVAASDSRGAAHDPEGLDHAELGRLIREERSIAGFDPRQLSAKGRVMGTETPEGVRFRNEVHNVARADVFIPAGGRPDTINEANWEAHLDADGRPTSRAIVEGANIFISQPARERLEDAGVVIVTGASANKTGVICSSYEVLAGLTLTDEEFVARKKRYVGEVLAILRRRARDEARALFREYRFCGGSKRMTAASRELSEEINTLADALAEHIETERIVLGADADFRELVLDYCPRTLSRDFAERIFSSIPEPHLVRLAAHALAARLVYDWGIGLAGRVADVSGAGELGRAYLAMAREAAELVQAVGRSRLAERERLLDILTNEGPRRLTLRRLGLE